MVAPYKPNNIQSAPEGRGGRGRGSGRFMNPDDFEAKYGYDYTDDPEFDSRSDAGGGDYALEGQRVSAGSIGGGYGKKRVGEQSRGQMNLTSGRTSSILTSKPNR